MNLSSSNLVNLVVLAARLSICIGLSIYYPSAWAGEGGEVCLRVTNLPDGARVEIDGVPVDYLDDCLYLSAGTYLVTVFPRAAPPFEEFVELMDGETREVEYAPTLPHPRLVLPVPGDQPEALVGPALVGASVVVGLAGTVWWLMANETEMAVEGVFNRDDLSESDRSRMLDDLYRRRSMRQDLAATSAAVAAALLVAGGTAWALGPIVDKDIYLSKSGGGMVLVVRIP